MNFSEALEKMKEGVVMTRAGWKNPNIKVIAHYPNKPNFSGENEFCTEPYLIMIKIVDGKARRFPLDLSCESIFAEDWKVLEEEII